MQTNQMNAGALPSSNKPWSHFGSFRGTRKFPAANSPSGDGRSRKGMRRPVVGYLTGLGIIFLITIFYVRVVPVKVTTAGFTFLLAILSASALWGLGTAAAMSVAAMLAFDYFYLPPTGSLDIHDPQDWVALFSFLITSVLGSSLAARARRQAQEADQRRREVEQLYDLSQRLSGAATLQQLAQSTPRNILESFGTSAAAVLLCGKAEAFRSGTEAAELDDARMRAASEGQEIRVQGERLLCFAPLRVGSRLIGSVGISGPAFSAATLRALGGLLSVSMERAGAIEHMTKMAASRESEQFKSLLLDAITHDFRTPLTCIKTSVTSLLDNLEFNEEQQKDMLCVIDEECDRIDQLLDKASEMARLESSEVRLKLAPHSVGELISAVVADCTAISRSRPMQFEIHNQESRICTDLKLAKSVLLHLIANAHLYSSPGEPITIRTSELDGYSLFSVADHGPGLDEREAALVFEKFYRCEGSGNRAPGTGMGLPIARAIVEAHRGTIQVVSTVGQGSVFTFSLPLVPPGECSTAEPLGDSRSLPPL